MPNINLIFEQRLAVKREERKARVFFLGFAASGVISVVAIAGLLFMTEQTRGEEASLRATAQKVQPIVAELEEVNKEMMALTPRVKTLEDARTQTDRWSHVLDHLTASTPQQTWLTAVRAMVIDPKKPILISFTGLAVKQELIGDFMLALQQSEDLENVTLRYSQEKPVQMGSQLEYQIEASLKGTATERVAAEEESK